MARPVAGTPHDTARPRVSFLGRLFSAARLPGKAAGKALRGAARVLPSPGAKVGPERRRHRHSPYTPTAA